MSTAHCTLQQALQQATQAIAQSLCLAQSEAAIEARVLLQQQLQQDHAWLISHYQDALSAHDQQAFQALVARRQQGEPIAYITGQREFFGLQLQVTPATLIPRADTELLVETALNLIAPNQAMHILDLGTGSGAIAIAIAKHRPRSQVLAVDASSAALEIAKHNAASHQLSNMQLLCGDWYAPVAQLKFDLIISNPPYIAVDDAHIQQGDLRFEPSTALIAGSQGLADIAHIVSHVRQHLKPAGKVLLEHGFQQAEQVRQIGLQAGFSDIRLLSDLAGLPRATLMA